MDGSALVARTGRALQRYENGRRLVAGCIPIRQRTPLAASENGGGVTPGSDDIEVLLISSRKHKGLVFPKGGWETDETAEQAAQREALEEAGVRGVVEMALDSVDFFSAREAEQGEAQGECRAHVFILRVTEQLDVWPEMHRRIRQWYPLSQAIEVCRHKWMRNSLESWRQITSGQSGR
eukprot:jgi/Chlat1/6062/Chrsp4S06215